MTRRLRLATLAGVLIAAFLAAAGPGQGTARPPRYVALGDSVSSGEGDAPYLPGTNQVLPLPDLCHRSSAAYPALVRAVRRRGTWAFWACSGARIRDLTARNAENPGELPQLDRIAPPGRNDPSVDLVTLTIGGNDAHFVLALACSASRLALPLVCPDNWRATVDEGIRSVRSALPRVLRALRTRAPNARILLLGYPDALPPALRAGTRCGAWFAPGDVVWIASRAAALNGAIREAAAASGARITYVPPTGFAGHDVCSQDSWFNAPQLEPSRIRGSFHPNALGQRQLAREVLARL